MPFYCTICEQESTQICVACTKDTCENHLCGKCARCSDCCSCEVALEAAEPRPHLHRSTTENEEAGVVAGDETDDETGAR